MIFYLPLPTDKLFDLTLRKIGVIILNINKFEIEKKFDLKKNFLKILPKLNFLKITFPLCIIIKLISR